jgi:hypothetical protein
VLPGVLVGDGTHVAQPFALNGRML